MRTEIPRALRRPRTRSILAITMLAWTWAIAAALGWHLFDEITGLLPESMHLAVQTAVYLAIWVAGLTGITYATLRLHAHICDLERSDRVRAAQMRLVDYSHTASVSDLLRRFLDEAEALTDSSIGFYHFVDDDQETLHLQTWSTNTLHNMCTVEGAGTHYPVSEAGVWVDCVRLRRPVVHNDYEALRHRKGMPAGHAPVTRELVVPVLRRGVIVAVLGVGNKERSYDDEDVQVVQRLADLAWETVVRRQAEEALQEHEERYRSLFQQSPEGILVVDEQGIVQDHNHEMLITGVPRETVIGRPLAESGALGEADPARIEALLERAAAGSTEPEDWEVERPEGRTMIVEVHPARVDEADGGYSLRLLKSDVTEQRQATQRLMQTSRLIALGEMAAGMAHELNQPLTVISTLSDGLQLRREFGMEMSDEDMKEWHDSMSEAIERMASTIEHLRVFSRDHTGDRPTPIAVSDVVDGVLSMAATQLRSHGIYVDVEVAPDLPKVVGNRFRLEQVLVNLVSNARDALDALPAEEPRRDKHVRLGAYREEGGVVLEVADNGIGMDAATLERALQPFFTTKGPREGTGLGLAISRAIVEDYGGRIECDSAPEGGCVFRVHLPEAAPDSLADASVEEDLIVG